MHKIEENVSNKIYYLEQQMQNTLTIIFAYICYRFCLSNIYYLEHLTNMEHIVGPSRSITVPKNSNAKNIFTVNSINPGMFLHII